MKERRRAWAMPSKHSKVVPLHYAPYISTLERNRSSRESLKHDGKTLPRKEKKPKLKASKWVHSYPYHNSFWLVLSTKTVLQELQYNRKSAQIARWNSLQQLYTSLEMTEFTLFLSCIYCAWTSQSHFTAFHRNYINWYTQSHQNLSSKTKDICIPHMYTIKSWLHFQGTVKETSSALDSSKTSNICCFPLNETTPMFVAH